MKNKGFTLIELLVVIAIIGLLASVVLVSTQGLQTKARLTKTLEFSQSVNNSLGAYLVGSWSFDEGAGTTALDASGYGNNGTISGAAYNADTPHAAIGRGTGKWALSFDGLNDYVEIPSSAIGASNQMTIEVWTKPFIQIKGAPYNDHADIVRSHCYGGGNWGISTEAGFNTNNLLAFSVGWIYGGDQWWNWDSRNTVAKNEWNHLVLTLDRNNGQAQFFRDGKFISSKTISVGSKPSTTGLHIGGDCAGTYTGLIDEVRIYETALTLGQIRQLYAEGLEAHQNIAIK